MISMITYSTSVKMMIRIIGRRNSYLLEMDLNIHTVPVFVAVL